MADEFEDQESGTDANQNPGQDDLAQLDRLIAADEAAEADRKQTANEQAVRRGSNGQFRSANDGPRAGQRLTPAEISAVETRGKTPPAAAAKSDATATNDTTPKPDEKADGEKQQQPGEQQQQAGDDDPSKSKYQKAREREARAWQEVNKAKDEAAAKAAELELREKTIAAREAAAAGRGSAPGAEPKWQGFTSGQLAQAALDYEARGEFEMADEARRIAGELRAKAAAPAPAGGTQGNGHGPNLQAHWQRLRTDLPELFNPNNPMNAEMRKLLESEPALLADEAGPYRAAIRTGRKAMARLEIEAKQVPGLQKQVGELTARLKELEAATAPGGGGEGASNRGSGSGGKPWAELSTAEMGAQLEREFATALGG